jgi:hypothetical protein
VVLTVIGAVRLETADGSKQFYRSAHDKMKTDASTQPRFIGKSPNNNQHRILNSREICKGWGRVPSTASARRWIGPMSSPKNDAGLPMDR